MATIPFTLASSFGTAVGSAGSNKVSQLLNKAKLHGARVQRKSEQQQIASQLGVSYECVRQIQSALYTNPQGLPWNPNAKAGSTCTPAVAEQFGYTFKGNEFDYINNVPVATEYKAGKTSANAALNQNKGDVIAAGGGAQSGANVIPVSGTVKAAQAVGMNAATASNSQQDKAGPLDFLPFVSSPSATPRLAPQPAGSSESQQANALGPPSGLSGSTAAIIGIVIGVASLALAIGQGRRGR